MSMTETTKVGGVVGAVMDFFRKRAGLVVVRGEKQMQVLETLSLGPKQRLVLVRCGEEKFLVGSGADGVRTI